MLFRFENVELDTEAYDLRDGGVRVPVEPQVFEVLTYLVTHRNRLVARTEILDAIWGDRFVSDGALASRVAAARAAIGDDGRSQRLIRTVHGRGLQFVGDVTAATGAAAVALTVSVDDTELHQTIRFCTAPDGVQLAVATVDAPTPTMVDTRLPLVKAPNWLTHVEKDWQSPVWAHWLTELARRSKFVRYDVRGGGLSDRDLQGSSLTDLDTWTEDLETVVESVDVDRFDLLGVSQGAAPAMAYAIRHPERVAHLVLYGAYSRGMKRRGPQSEDEANLIVDLIRNGWGGRNPAFRSFFTSMFMPEATSEQMRWFNELQMHTASPENAVLLETAFFDHDFAEIARQVAVPTLVLHCREDMATPYNEGRRLAGLIPDAKFVTLESPNHILTADEPAWPEFLGQLDRFVTS